MLRISCHYPGLGDQNSDLSLEEDQSGLKTSITHILPKLPPKHPREMQLKGEVSVSLQLPVSGLFCLATLLPGCTTHFLLRGRSIAGCVAVSVGVRDA